MFFILSIIISLGVAIAGFSASRNFVTRRLRYVDAVQTAIAPIVAGLVAGVVALPLVAILPLVGVGTAITFGLSVGTGVAAGAREVRRSLPRW